MSKINTSSESYTSRLKKLEYKRWKGMLGVQLPYRHNILSLHPGRTLDIGCGIGRYLKVLPLGSVGIDHNPHSIAQVRAMGLIGYVSNEFTKSKDYSLACFDSILLSHVLEHMKPNEGVNLIKKYLPLLKKHGKVIICCPQEKGYTTDQTHITFLDAEALDSILKKAGLHTIKSTSFPFPRAVGRYFTYNEFVVVGQK